MKRGKRGGARILEPLRKVVAGGGVGGAQQAEAGWRPVRPRKRRVSTALKAYALLATSADRGAVRDLSRLPE